MCDEKKDGRAWYMVTSKKYASKKILLILMLNGKFYLILKRVFSSPLLPSVAQYIILYIFHHHCLGSRGDDVSNVEDSSVNILQQQDEVAASVKYK